MPPSPQAYSHGASPPGWDAPQHAGTRGGGAGVCAAAPEERRGAAEYRVLRTYEADPRCNARPTLAASVAGGFPSGESRSPKLHAVESQVPVHRLHWLVDSEVAFSTIVAPSSACFDRGLG